LVVCFGVMIWMAWAGAWMDICYFNRILNTYYSVMSGVSPKWTPSNSVVHFHICETHPQLYMRERKFYLLTSDRSIDQLIIIIVLTRLYSLKATHIHNNIHIECLLSFSYNTKFIIYSQFYVNKVFTFYVLVDKIWQILIWLSAWI
jgi:hypothetical protein